MASRTLSAQAPPSPGATAELIRCLADGRFHTGPALGRQLGISRAAVWKRLQRLPELGLELERARGSGYRLIRALDLLDLEAVRASYQTHSGPAARIELVQSTGSTNSDLLARAAQAASMPLILLAEHQGHGRGRHGREWVTPYGGAIAFSVLRRFELAPAQLGALSLVVGMALVEALGDAGARGLGLKWPNDLVHADADGTWRKLGGILLEVQAEAHGPSAVVIGVGLNYALGEGARRIDQPACDLDGCMRLTAGARSVLAGRLLSAVASACARFARGGAAADLTRWQRYDVLRDAPVDVRRGRERLSGHACGINAEGALRLRTATGLIELHAGDVSLRPADA